MFSNPLGSVFNNKPEGEEKKKKRNRKTKKLSPELSEESLGSKNDLSGAQEPQTSASPIQQLAEAGNTLLDIVSEINNPQAVAAPEEPVVETAPVEEPVVETAPVEEPAAEEQVETQYEELPVEESTMKTIIDSIHSFNSSNQVPSEEAWESEVAAAPQSVDSVWETMLSAPEQPAETEPVFKLAAPAVESCWEDFLSTPEPSAEEESAVPEPSTEESVVVDEQKNRVLEQFNISETSYELVKDFFNEQQSEQLLKNELLRYLLNQALANRAELQGVSEEDVNRALKAIDSNQDDKVNFDEFVQLLTLFFSSKNNLQQRIAGVLNNLSSSHAVTGFLCHNEACSFTKFLDLFFGRKSEEAEEEASSDEPKKGNFLSKLVKKILKRVKSEDESENEPSASIDYATYSVEAAQDLQDLCFVKFN